MALFRSRENGNKYILVICDYFTKWVEAIPIPNQEASTVAESVVTKFICVFGVPLQIHTDQGTNFESKLFQEICRLLGLKKTRTTPLHPQSDGLVERANRTLANMLSKFVSEEQKDWDTYLPYLLMAYRSSVHSTTGHTPNKLVFGRDVSLPIDLMLGRPENSDQICATDFGKQLEETLLKVHDFTRARMKLQCNKMKKTYDYKISYTNYNIGDLVWLHSPRKYVGLNPKLQRPWEGPYTVIDKLNDVLYQIVRNSRCKPKVVHHDRLKPYHVY